MHAALCGLYRLPATMTLLLFVGQIPAIRHSPDKAMKIVRAQLEDAKLAAHAVKQLAIISSSPTTTTKNELHYIQEGNRRFEQLAECVHLCLQQMRVTDIVRYSWGLTMLGVQDEQKYSSILSEYARRFLLFVLPRGEEVDGTAVRPAHLSSTDLASIVWTLGCIKDVSGMTNQTLVKEVSLSLLRSLELYRTTNQDACDLSPRLAIRVLWSLALHGIDTNDADMDRLVQLCLSHSSTDQSPSIAHCMSLLWCCSGLLHLRLDRDVPLIARLLDGVLDFLRGGGVIPARECAKLYGALLKLSHAMEEDVVSCPALLVTNALEDSMTDRFLSAVSAFEVAEKIRCVIICSFSRIREQLHEASVATVTSILHAVAGLNCLFDSDSGESFDDGVRGFLSTCSQRIELALQASGKDSMSTLEACNVLKAISQKPSYPFFWVREKDIGHLYSAFVDLSIESNCTMHKVITGMVASNASGLHDMMRQSQAKSEVVAMEHMRPKLVWDYLVEDPSWHRIAGRLAVRCALQSDTKFANYRTSLVNSCWAIARLGHSYRPLLRRAHKVAEFHLSDLSATTLAHLVVAVAAEEGSGIGITELPVTAQSSAGSFPPQRMNHEFVDHVTMCSLRKLREMHDVEDFWQTIVAAAGLGRLASVGTKTHWSISALDINRQLSPPADNGMVLPARKLKYLSSSKLIKLQWAAGRLPDGLIDRSSLQHVQTELTMRLNAVRPSSDGIICSGDGVDEARTSIFDDLLLLNTALHSRASGSSNGPRTDVHKELLKRLQAAASSRYSWDKNSDLGRGQTMTGLVVAIETLQACIDLDWVGHYELVDAVTPLLSASPDPLDPRPTGTQFQLGLLEELVQCYKSKCDTHGNGSVLKFTKRILRFFNLNFN